MPTPNYIKYILESPNKCGNTNVVSGLTLQNFIDIGRFYEKVSKIDTILNGSSPQFINDLIETEETLKADTKQVVKQLVENLKSDFSQYLEPFHRLKLLVDEITRFGKRNPDDVAFREIQIGSWGKLSDVFNVYALFRYKGWHWINKTENSTCKDVLSILKLSINNDTLLSAKLKHAYDTTLRHSRRFEPFLHLIQNKIRDRSESTTTELLIHVCRILNGFAEPGSGRLEEVLEVRLNQQFSVKEACECVNVQPPPGYEEELKRYKLARKRRYLMWWPFL
ncbi:unnamed protein product [Bursaphelenchus okinawaensis]|uniref:Uncharacterized protein n=1 Tax=Bursaphelenchus okinawaensis TaxID=465554 RepID=A0A811KBP8_9BILA|nr:unnamed protein product [Bursaphelenchus okinawaensis]CAG9099568.1 unnamed protein product [Bursaphelenchus okinawaensis]